ncbi:hypothetical protein J3458_014507 [Metarhizium acridum]|uniref:uncharacterized protein n=1 Tax=Metarhizium acridum TaxID=92637 RepID=UPI001C6BDED3|nr:hypothetical protein J3458_014507 [Metarhizium acridum]
MTTRFDGWIVVAQEAIYSVAFTDVLHSSGTIPLDMRLRATMPCMTRDSCSANTTPPHELNTNRAVDWVAVTQLPRTHGSSVAGGRNDSEKRSKPFPTQPNRDAAYGFFLYPDY